jgi:type III secretion protein SpaR/YscT/HrcT
MEESYLAVFLNSAFNKGDALPVLTLFFLFLARFLPIIALSPFFGAKVLPHPVKLTFAISMFILFFPKMLDVTTTAVTFNLKGVLLILKETFIGFLIGFIIGMPFMIVQSSGIIIDHQRGGASLMVNDPTIQNQSSPLGLLFNYVLILVFFWLDGPFLFLDTIITSYEVIPPDKFLSPHFFDKDLPLWTSIVKILNEVMIISIRLATPALIMILMTDFFLGIANRLAPQVQITFLGMPLKSLLALLIICLGWKQLVSEFGKQSFYWINQVVEMLKVVKGMAT